MSKPTPHQQTAIHRTSHTAVIANAGSGKTKVLVDRYLHVLLTNPHLSPHNVVAITFTIASADDMKEKIRERIEDMLSDTEVPTETYERLLDIRDTLQTASISTIHAFCGYILRQYPKEANIDAGFAHLVSPQDKLLRERCIQDVLYEELEAAYQTNEKDNPIAELFRLVKRIDVVNYIRVLFSKQGEAHILYSWLSSHSDEEIFISWRNSIEHTLDNEYLNAMNMQLCAEMCNYYLNNTKNRKSDKYKEVELVSSMINQFKHIQDRNQKLRIADDIHSTLFVGEWSNPGKVFYSKDDIHTRSILQSYIAVIEPYRVLAKTYIDTKSEEISHYIQLQRTILTLYTRVNEYYVDQKNSLSLLDFDDLLTKTSTLLEQETVSHELSELYPFILVDEYQDTNDVQYNIIMKITRQLTAGNLMVVGDPKQSIYRFRNANVELFTKMMKEVESKTQQDSVILGESFRMLRTPLAFINYVFEKLMYDNSTTGYQPLVLGRSDDAVGSVTFLIEPKQKNNDEKSAEGVSTSSHLTEPELVARTVLNAVSGSENKFMVSSKDRGGDTVLCPPEFRQIAVIARTYNTLSKIAEEFSRYNIPFTLQKAKEFYDEQEIIDSVTFLQFMLSPDDEIALAALLRSAFFGISDELLLNISYTADYNTAFWDKVMSSKDEYPELLHALQSLTKFLELSGRISTAKLLQKFYMETGVYASYSALPLDGEQTIANLEKFVDIVSGIEASTGASLFEVVEQLNLYRSSESEESQAVINDSEDVVNLMTIHSSKGLEFPIVIVAGTNKLTGNNKDNTFLRSDTAFAFPSKINEKRHLPIYELLKIKNRKEDSAESMRILYVALTRAKEHLIISASRNGNESKDSYLSALERVLDSEVDTPFSISSHYLRYNIETQVHEALPFELSIDVKSYVDSVEFTQEKPIVTEEQQYEISDLIPSDPVLRFSPSQLLTHRECPTKYYLRYNLGLPEIRESILSYEQDEETEFNRTDIGSLVHSVFERIDAIRNGTRIDEAMFSDMVSNALERLAVSLTDESKTAALEAVRPHIDKFLCHTESEYIFSAKRYFTEYPLRYWLTDNRILSCIIDRLYEHADGSWTILDYKTNKRNHNPEQSKRYEFQMKCYAFIVRKMYPEAKNISARLFYSTFGTFTNFNFSDDDLTEFKEELVNQISQIRNEKLSSSLGQDYIKRNRDHCNDCGYYDEERRRCLADVS